MKDILIQDIRAFNRFYTDVIGLLNQHLLDSPYSLAEARVIYEIFHGRKIRASQIMTIMDIDKSYLSRILKKLGKNGIIVKKRSDEDARALILSLTDKGIKEFEMLNRASNGQVGNLLKPLTGEHRQELVHHMQAVMDILKMKSDTNTINTLINPADVDIRTQLLPGDLGYVAYLHGWLYARESDYGFGFETYVMGGLYEFAKQYDPAKDRIWICEHQQKIVGFLLGYNRGDAVQLRYFILLPEYRGLGLGKKLMNLFMSYLKEIKCKKAYLWTTNEQETAISLYTRHGFRLTEEKESQSFGKHLTERRYDLESA